MTEQEVRVPGPPTPRFHIEIDVYCETLEQAEQVAAERLGHDEDYGFEYRFGETHVNPNPEGQLPNGPNDPETLQVFFAHRAVIDAFRSWVAGHGWQLGRLPRFDEPAHHYIPTHIITPSDAAMRAVRPGVSGKEKS